MNQCAQQKETLSIHIVCTGNIYRSRLAEAYLKAKQLPYLSFSSSGTEVTLASKENGPISWYAMRLMSKYHLIPFMSFFSQQTTVQLLRQADIVIFMHHDSWFAQILTRFQNCNTLQA